VKVLRNIFKHLQTTSGAIVILLVWLAPKVFHIEVPAEVQTALIAVIGAILLGLAQDPGKS